MALFDRGTGPPVVVIQGLHGRWQWMEPALVELSKRCRTVSYALCGDFGSGCRTEPSPGLDDYVSQLDGVLARVGVDRAALCGISFGGFVAVRYAAARPQRVSALIVASSPGPGWEPSARQSRWLARPWLSTPSFVLSAPFRLWPEISAALPGRGSRVSFLARQALRAVRAPMIPSLMAQRIRQTRGVDLKAECCRVVAPTLVITGEADLDRVVPAETTRRYASLVRGAQYRLMERTGHIGSLTQPARFARIVADFVHAHRD